MTDSTVYQKGRNRLRLRHMYRKSRQRLLRAGIHLKFGTANTAGLDWRRWDNAEKMHDIILFARKEQYDVLSLSELHNEGLVQLRLDEFILIMHGRAGVLLNVTGRMAWELAGSQVLPWSGIHLVLPLKIQDVDQVLHVVSGYHLTGMAVHERQEMLHSAHGLYLKLYHLGNHQLRLGDWNAHIGTDTMQHNIGTYLLRQSTTSAGKFQAQWLANTDLQLVDSFHKCKFRRTWQHHNGSWYEIDQMWASPSVAKAVHHIRTVVNVFADHRAKMYDLCFQKTGTANKQAQRKEKFVALQIKKRMEAEKQEKPRLNYEKLRGGTKEAEENRQKYQEAMDKHTRLWLQRNHLEAEVPTLQHWNSFSGPFPTSELSYHIFVDGGGEKDGLAAGWSFFVIRGERAAVAASEINESNKKDTLEALWSKLQPHNWNSKLYFGPVITSFTEGGFCGAEALTNNTGEMSAQVYALAWLLLQQDAHPCTIFYDSKYACQMAEGKWRPKHNITLARTLRSLFLQSKDKRPLLEVHLNSHVSWLGNEIADRGATKGKENEISVPVCAPQMYNVINTKGLPKTLARRRIKQKNGMARTTTPSTTRTCSSWVSLEMVRLTADSCHGGRRSSWS